MSWNFPAISSPAFLFSMIYGMKKAAGRVDWLLSFYVIYLYVNYKQELYVSFTLTFHHQDYSGKMPDTFKSLTRSTNSFIIFSFIASHVMLEFKSHSYLQRIRHFFKTPLVSSSSSCNSEAVMLEPSPSCNDYERNL